MDTVRKVSIGDIEASTAKKLKDYSREQAKLGIAQWRTKSDVIEAGLEAMKAKGVEG